VLPRVSQASPNPWTTIAGLATTQTISWGVLYYTFPVLLVPMAEDLGSSPASLTGAFSLALVTAGVAALFVGRWIDRHGARTLMTVGSMAATLVVLAWAAVTNVVGLYGVGVAMGIVMATTLYEPALAVVAHYLSAVRHRALLVITVTAAVASTIFSPLAAALARLCGWRLGLVVLAGLLLLVTVPLHALALPRHAPATPSPSCMAHGTRSAGVSFRSMTVAFALEKAVAAAVTVHIVVFLVDSGASLGRAAAAAGLVGAAKVVGRLAATLGVRHWPALRLSTWVFATQSAALAIPLVDPGAGGLSVAALVGVFGATSGAATVLWPLSVMQQFGTEQFGRLSGVGAFASTIPKAVAPAAVGLVVAATGSYTAAWGGLAGLAAGASVICRRAGLERRDPGVGPGLAKTRAGSHT
jgi:predicted MFS family arabinose efflux permease